MVLSIRVPYFRYWFIHLIISLFLHQSCLIMCLCLPQLRRGADQADIYCISFSCTNHWLAVSSDKGTIHIFCLKEDRSIHSRNAMSSSSSHFGFPLSLPSNLTSSINNGLQLARSSFMSFSQSNTGSSLSFMKGLLFFLLYDLFGFIYH